MATLNEAELTQAVKEWCERRGITPTDEVEFVLVSGSVSMSSKDSDALARMKNIDMPPKEGPYR